MIFVSPEQGSHDLVEPLRRAKLEVDEVKLDFADVEFIGRGINGVPVRVGIEVKRISELTSDWDRLCGEQIPKMLNNYDYRYLLFEGEWRQDKQGKLLKFGKGGKLSPHHGQNNASALRKKLYGLSLRAGVLTYPTKDHADTVRHLVDLYRLWTDDDFEDHTSHLVVYHPHGFIKHSDFVQAVSAWPRVGVKIARAAEKAFKNVRRAAMAGVKEWAEVETVDGDGKTRRVGTKVAESIDAFLKGEK